MSDSPGSITGRHQWVEEYNTEVRRITLENDLAQLPGWTAVKPGRKLLATCCYLAGVEKN